MQIDITEYGKMKKPKKQKQKQDKMKAFMSFLQAPNMSDSIIIQSEKRNASDNQQYEQFVEDTNQCYICKQNLDPVKKKKCGFCNTETCNNHLRKRRRLNKKFQRICDYCEDKQLFDNYMKLQIKAQQALTTQEQIISLKYNEYVSQVQKKRQKRNDLIFKSETLKTKFQQQMHRMRQDQQQLQYKQRSFQKQQLQFKQIQMHAQRLGNALKQNLEEDYKILLIQNQKLGKDLTNLDKRRMDVQKAIQKRQKQIQLAYQQWQKKQYIKKLEKQTQGAANKKKECIIF